MRKKEEAMRIMEAFSGVDEELLERCEAEGKAVRGKKRRLVRRIWRYAGSCAAVLCLAAVGVFSWEAFRLLKNGQEQPQEPFSPNPEFEQMAQGAFIQEEAEVRKEAKQETLPSENSFEDGLNDSTMELCRKNTAVRLTEEQVRQTGALGEALPAVLPQGYGFESAYYYEETDELNVCWVRGMDSIMLSLKHVDVEQTEIIDIAKPECYDRRLYEIPYAETVPEEYFETMNNPVFALEDFGLEIVRSRVVANTVDTGDTDTPRGSFSVLYPDGLLIRFNGRGTPEQIWEMISSINVK